MIIFKFTLFDNMSSPLLSGITKGHYSHWRLYSGKF